METYVRNLQTYIRENKITFDQDCPQPCLDALWWHYSEHHNPDSKAVKEWYQALWAHLEALSIQDPEEVLNEVSVLCSEYERNAFTAGIRLGVQLMLEMQADR